MSYILEDLTPESCIRVQDDLCDDWPNHWPDHLLETVHKRGAKPGISFEYATPYGDICHLSSWAIDRNRNYYAIEISYVLGVNRVLLYLDGEKYLLETEYQTRILKPIPIEDPLKKEKVTHEAKEALDVLNYGMYYFKEDI
ncbi:hypothetical protein O5O45_08045 [Hahella aquimaris]|uniref:hypothetical protein n=1 Tax=Hahella sp. HNIBRBA332 TaxID=3015983 RepID=UPI00273BC974|nr:hypothetical protein [Hahella sp. HNIBRBA332]WLQ15863.1 hypothetical protein O5O45_08045 [Hahella sp. HNIBRBA332]